MVLRFTREWDVRVPEELKALIPSKGKRKGYWFKVGLEGASRHVEILSQLYNIQPPKIVVATTMGQHSHQKRRIYAQYSPRQRRIIMRNRNHLKSIWHEWYHHLDAVTGKYDSCDFRGGSSSLAWQFADKVWELIRT